jgi:hypothetical protein
MGWLFSTIKPRGYASKFKLHLGGRPLPLFEHSGKSYFEERISIDVWGQLVTSIFRDQGVQKHFLGHGDGNKKFLQNVNRLISTNEMRHIGENLAVFSAQL